jgi:hypothetical protein
MPQIRITISSASDATTLEEVFTDAVPSRVVELISDTFGTYDSLEELNAASASEDPEEGLDDLDDNGEKS